VSRIVVGPFNRVEGDLEVELEVADSVVSSARVRASLFRGFEQILQGKVPEDALVFAPRICGICSVSQSAAAAGALADAMGIVAPRNGRLAKQLMQGVENLADHLSHFYLFFMPDFARPAYSGRSWHGEVAARFRAIHGSAAAEFLPARAGLMRALGLLAGKWPHTQAFLPGGTSRPLQSSERIRLYRLLREFRGFLEAKLFGDALEAVAGIDCEDRLMAWAQGRSGDFCRFLAIAEDLGLQKLGRSWDRFISYGSYNAEDGGVRFAQGLWEQGSVVPLNVLGIQEDVHYAWYAEGSQPQAPSTATAPPMPDKEGAYTWCKAPRIHGKPAETGALARQLISGHPLASSLVAADGANVKSRVVGRLLEVARLLPALETWAEALRPGESFCEFGQMPEEATGLGLVEAARGSLGHWLTVRHGRIHNYQIVSPTTWNFSPRDTQDQPGPLERALVGTPVGPARDAADAPPVAVQHVVRSFDPCMVCTVH
jgi:Ni,Fe-hydrogenase I large subunit